MLHHIPLYFDISVKFQHCYYYLPFESLRKCKSSHVSRTLLSILHDRNNAVIWIVSESFPISNPSSLSNLLGIILSPPITLSLTPWEFFTSALADGLSLEFEWQQISSNIQDSSQYSVWSQWRCSLDCLHLSRYFQVLQSVYQSFSDSTKSTNYNWYNRHFHVPQFFSILWQGPGTFTSFRYLSILPGDQSGQ